MSYNKVANVYDSYHPWWYLLEDKITLDRIKLHGDILDIGCGSGTLLEMTPILSQNYTGIDPSKEMLAKAREKHPGYTFIESYAQSFMPAGRYDTAVLFFGTASYLTFNEIKSCLRFLREDGTLYFHLYGKGRDWDSPTAKLDKELNDIQTWNEDVKLPCYNINPFHFLRPLKIRLGFEWQFLPKRCYAWSLYSIQKRR